MLDTIVSFGIYIVVFDCYHSFVFLGGIEIFNEFNLPSALF